jgi:hypothetical protein
MNYLNIFQDSIVEKSFDDKDEYYDSKDFFQELFSNPMNYDLVSFENKLKLFCPYFLPLIEVSESPKCLEFYSGFGLFLELAKKYNQESQSFFLNTKESNSNKLAEKIYNDSILLVDDNTNEQFDFVFTDGTFNLFSDEEIFERIETISRLTKVGGTVCLLVNLDPLSLRKDFDITKIHSQLQKNNFISTWGKNTFCSLWLKK